MATNPFADRHKKRHAGKRQIPFPHEHYLMAHPPEGSKAEEDQETPAQEAAEEASGQGDQ